MSPEDHVGKLSDDRNPVPQIQPHRILWDRTIAADRLRQRCCNHWSRLLSEFPRCIRPIQIEERDHVRDKNQCADCKSLSPQQLVMARHGKDNHGARHTEAEGSEDSVLGLERRYDQRDGKKRESVSLFKAHGPALPKSLSHSPLRSSPDPTWRFASGA